ncbi:MAG: endolytic transglycosylase MltG [Clostridia bacterium]|nr:endolytic transglycosylase MltG [Clostridia bacterium]
MKKLLFIVLVAIMLCSCGNNNEAVTVKIAEGESVSIIAQTLKDNGLINSKLLFKLKVDDTDGYLKPGQYTIKKGTSQKEIIAILKAGVSENVPVTIPEGYSVEMIAKTLEDAGVCSQNEFLDACNKTDYDFDFLKGINPKGNYKLQGFLYPNTYYFTLNMQAEQVVKIMLSEFQKQITYNGVTTENLYKKVTVASLLQREAKVQSEKPTIAGVIYNRLKIDMLLQIDASVVYGVTDGMYDITAVYNSHLKSNSPYNLYKFKGLPPGPISNPDIQSIVAAQNPQSHDYLYYRTDENKKDGTHIFTKTFNEHLNANN